MAKLAFLSTKTTKRKLILFGSCPKIKELQLITRIEVKERVHKENTSWPVGAVPGKGTTTRTWLIVSLSVS